MLLNTKYDWRGTVANKDISIIPTFCTAKALAILWVTISVVNRILKKSFHYFLKGGGDGGAGLSAKNS